MPTISRGGLKRRRRGEEEIDSRFLNLKDLWLR